VASDTCSTPEGARKELSGVDAVCVPGGFGVRGIEGKLGALRWARENQVPTLGLCLGLQCMVIEYARTVLGLADASSSEFDPGTEHPVIATMDEQKSIVAGEGDMGGTMRLGLYPAALKPGSVVAAAYGSERVSERHRHRYEVNNEYREQLEAAGLVVSGESPDRRLVEFVELPREVHPYYVSTQAHPEFLSRPDRAHPLFAGLVAAGLERQREERLIEVEQSPSVDDDEVDVSAASGATV
jgi:CTP synthase